MQANQNRKAKKSKTRMATEQKTEIRLQTPKN
jgi:hypothetical protein